MVPWFTSAWVTVYDPVKMADCPGTSVVVAPEHVPVGDVRAIHVAVTMPAGLTGTSVTPTLVIVTFPELVTEKV